MFLWKFPGESIYSINAKASERLHRRGDLGLPRQNGFHTCFHASIEGPGVIALCFQGGRIAPKEDGKNNHPSEGQKTRLRSRVRPDEFP